MADGPKSPPDGEPKPRPKPRRSALDMRVLSSSIVAGAEETPSQPTRSEPEPDLIVVPPATAAAAAAAPAPVAKEPASAAVIAPHGPRFVWMLGGVAIALVVVLAAAMPRAAKRASTPAKVATAAEPVADGSASAKKPTGTKSASGKTKTKAEARTNANKAEPDSEIDMSGDSAPSTKTAAKSDTKSDTKSDDKPDLKAGAPRADAKQRAEAELAYRDGEQRAAMGDTAGAKASLLHAAELNPSYAPTYRALGDVYAKTGDTGRARTSYQRYLKLAPTASDAGNVRDRLKAL